MKRPAPTLLPLGLCLLLAGCAAVGPPVPPSLELPKPPLDLKASRKGEHVTLTWTIPGHTMQHQSMRHLGATQICRILDSALKQCDKAVASVGAPADFATRQRSGQRVTATYVDDLSASGLPRSNPFSVVTYAVEVLNSSGRGAGLSNQVHVPLALIPSPPADFSARVTAQGIVLTWSAHDLPPADKAIRFRYRVFRRLEGSAQPTQIAELDASSPEFTFTDSDFEWEKTYFYRVEILALFSPPGQPEFQTEGDDTADVKVFADDIFPPAVPTALQAAFSGPGQAPFIDLVWSPVSDADLAGYNIYRYEAGAPPVKLNPELVKTPAFRDTDVASGKTYTYSVSAVDLRGNESARSAEASETVP